MFLILHIPTFFFLYFRLDKIVDINKCSIFKKNKNKSLFQINNVAMQISIALVNLVYSVTRLGDLLNFGQLFKPCGNNYSTQIAHI